MLRIPVIPAVLMSCWLVPAGAAAEPITFSFSVIVNSVYGDVAALVPGGVRAGDSIQGRYTFDSRAVDSNPDPDIGAYPSTGDPYHMRLNIGGSIVSTGPLLVFSAFSGSFSSYGVGAQTERAGFNRVDMHIAMGEWERPFVNDALPLEPPDPAQFRSTSFFLIGTRLNPDPDDDTFNGAGIQGTLTSLQRADMVPTPEPGTFALFGLASVAAALTRRRTLKTAIRRKGSFQQSHAR